METFKDTSIFLCWRQFLVTDGREVRIDTNQHPRVFIRQADGDAFIFRGYLQAKLRRNASCRAIWNAINNELN